MNSNFCSEPADLVWRRSVVETVDCTVVEGGMWLGRAY